MKGSQIRAKENAFGIRDKLWHLTGDSTTLALRSPRKKANVTLLAYGQRIRRKRRHVDLKLVWGFSLGTIKYDCTRLDI
ncbi:unnamed protein product [Enterobius vermicularis]|uniref:LAM_G_DOMAIN domain-containing protein n=1 Tax=Enterobius vermicularis TaxID=51028 RepID=A0A0N4UXE0_ENTVE|nr:unnamed protein product [Enterobius vermicularis]